jgi:hypothetical protein
MLFYIPHPFDVCSSPRVVAIDDGTSLLNRTARPASSSAATLLPYKESPSATFCRTVGCLELVAFSSVPRTFRMCSLPADYKTLGDAQRNCDINSDCVGVGYDLQLGYKLYRYDILFLFFPIIRDCASGMSAISSDVDVLTNAIGARFYF